MVTEEVIKNQEKGTKLRDAMYTVVLSGGGATNEEKPVLEALLPGIRLHFLRYGMFPKNDSNVHAIRIKDREDDKFTLSDADVSNGDVQSNDHFRVMATTLNEGYVYLINAENKNDYHELEVDAYGMLKPILWRGTNLNKDGRTPKDFRMSGEEKSHYRLVAKIQKEGGIKYWAGYSPIQWSYELHKSMLNGSDDDKKKMQMILVECKGIKKGEERATEHILPYTKVQIGYTETENTHHNIRTTLNQINQTEKQEEKRGDNDLYEDMFITLNDPIGCAMDIGVVLANKIAYFEAFVESLATGVSPKKIKKRILEGKPRKKATKGSEQEQLEALFATALATYQLVYNDSEMENDYDGGKIGFWNLESSGNGIHKEKLINVLGVKERKKLREDIVPFRKHFCDILQSEYYNTYYKGYLEDGFSGLLQSKLLAIQHIILLRTNPDDLDKHLDLIAERSKYPVALQNDIDEINKFHEDLLKDTSDIPLVQLLNANLDLDYLDDKEAILSPALLDDLANKTATLISESLNAHIALSVSEKIKFELIFNRLKTFNYKGSPVFQLRMQELEAELAKNALLLDRSRVQFLGYRNGNRLVKIKAADGIELVDEYKPKGQNILQLDVETIPKKTTQQVKGAQKIFNSVHFTGVLALLQIANISFATRQVVKDFDKKNILNFLGIASELRGAIAYYQRARLLSKGVTSGIRFDVVSNSAKKFGNIGSVITIAVCIWESYDAFSTRDRDSALAWSGAAVAFATGIFVTGPAGWLIGGLGIGLVFIANYLKDTPLQTYFKYFILSDAVAQERKDEEPWEYNKRLYKDRTRLLDDPEEEPYDTFSDLRVAHQKLLDLIICSDMAIAPYKVSNIRSMQIGHHGGAQATLTTKDISVFKIQTSFRQFLHNEEQYEFKVFITNNKSSNVRELEECNLTYKKTIIKDDRDIPAVELLVHVPKEVHEVRKKKENIFSLFQFVLVCRLKIDNDKYYPYTYMGSDRWMAVKTALTTSRVHDLKNMDGLLFKPQFPQEEGKLYRKNVKVGTLPEIKEWSKKWELKI